MVYEEIATMFAGGTFGALFGALLAVGIILAIAVYAYYAFAWMTIARKMNYKYPWLAWIPVANAFLIPILAGKKWPWGFIFLVPIVNLVFYVIWRWRIFEKRKYPGWLSLITIVQIIPVINWLGTLGDLIIIGLVAWADRK